MESACNILSVAACPSSQYFFSGLSHKRHVFFGEMLLNINLCFEFSLQIILSETFLIVRRFQLDIIINVNKSLR